MRIYASFKAALVIDGEIEDLVKDPDLPRVAFYWGEIGDLIDGYREELLGFDSSLQFDFSDTFNEEDFRVFDPRVVLDTLQKIQTILEVHAGQLPQCYLVYLEGFE